MIGSSIRCVRMPRALRTPSVMSLLVHKERGSMRQHGQRAGTTLPQRSLRPPQPSTQVTRSRTYREAMQGPPILAGHHR